jgi:hypothetical protein
MEARESNKFLHLLAAIVKCEQFAGLMDCDWLYVHCALGGACSIAQAAPAKRRPCHHNHHQSPDQWARSDGWWFVLILVLFRQKVVQFWLEWNQAIACSPYHRPKPFSGLATCNSPKKDGRTFGGLVCCCQLSWVILHTILPGQTKSQIIYNYISW